MKSYKLGLDIGTNSIGWVLLFDDKIIDGGVIIFPIGTNLVKGTLEESKNSQRRSYRSIARNLFRFKLRRNKLKKILSGLDMLPDFNSLEKPSPKELYKIRSESLDHKIDRNELGRIWLLLNKHRGYKSNSKTLSIQDDEEGAVSSGISQLKSFMSNHNARTVGEYFHFMFNRSEKLFNTNQWHNIQEPLDERALENDALIPYLNRGIRRENGRYVSREMYENEFDQIWREQKKHYPELTGSKEEYDLISSLPVAEKRDKLSEFKKTLYWKIKNETIYYQRPLKSQKKYIGKCIFEKNKRTAPISSLLYQEFRLWKQISDLRYSDFENDFINKPLPFEWKKKIHQYLEHNPTLPLGVSKKNNDIFDVLEITNKKKYEFNNNENSDDRSLNGNKTTYAIVKSCGIDFYNSLKAKNKLDALWHILYMAKDDTWLKDKLEQEWKLSAETSNKLIDMGLEDGFASYSAKVLKKIIPYLREGHNEYDALILAGYIKSSDEVKEDIPLHKKIKPLTNNELRNPVVEKSINETIRLVNSILNQYQINQEHFTIHIESTREFKKPKNEREAMRRGNTEIDKRREEYARFLNQKRAEGKLKFNREIQKQDNIIQKFELWLELGADKDDEQFDEFEKIVKRNDREKHDLWLECNRICPYSGRIISLTMLFSPEIEIEHIIPYSRSLDDSFINKTITFCDINKVKGNLTSFEFIHSKGKDEFKKFIKRLEVFSKEKRENRFLLETVPQEFSNNQITNTSYIAKYVRLKLQEVCKDVQFTNGSATSELRKNDWKLGSLLDKIRYEEEFQEDIDIILDQFKLYKRDFIDYIKRKENSTDIPAINWKNLTPDITADYEAKTKNPLYEWWQKIQRFDEFRGAKGKKDRSDHRHHLLDAVITALTSRKIIQQLSTLNALREKQGYSMYDEYGHITREEIPLPISIEDIKTVLKNVLVYHKPEQKLLTVKNNKIRVRINGKTKYIKQKTFAPRGPLVRDSLYGKLKDPSLQKIDKMDAYTKRVNLNKENFPSTSALDKVVDIQVKEILRRRLEKYENKGEKAFSEENLKNDPIYAYSTTSYPDGIPEYPLSKKGNPLPVIKKVRILNKNSRNLVQLPAYETNELSTRDKVLVNENRYSETDGNYVMALYESKTTDKKGKIKIKRDFELVSFYEAVKRRIKKQELFPDEKMQKDGTYLPLMKSCPYLKKDDLVLLNEIDENEIDWSNKDDLNRRLYIVNGISSMEVTGYEYGIIFMTLHNVSGQNAKFGKTGRHVKQLHSQINAIKVKLNNLGRIEKIYK